MSMKSKHLVVLLISLIVVVVVSKDFLAKNAPKRESSDLFVGVDVAYEDLAAIKELVDEVGSYTNLFVIGCTGINLNDIKLNETCQYL